MSRELDDLMKSEAIKFAEWINSIYIICQGGWMQRYQNTENPRKYSTEELWEDFNMRAKIIKLK